MRKWVIVGVVILVILGGGLVAQRRNRPAASTPPVPAAAQVDVAIVEVARVTRGPIERTLELTGSIVSTQRVELTPKIAGKIAAILVSEGARVARWQPVARLEAAELAAGVSQAEQGVRQARAGQEVARARLAAVESGARTQERALALNAVAQAEAGFRNAEANAQRMQQLFEAGAVSRQQLDAALLQRDVAKAQLDSARQQVSLLETGARAEDVRMARAQVAQADAVHASALAALRLTRAQLSSATIRAPFSGRISEIPVSLGEFVAPGMKVAVLYDDRRMEAEVTVGERDVRLLRPGQPVSLEPEAAPGTVVAGAIRLILPTADPVSRAAKVRIRLLNPATLPPGTSVRGRVVLERHLNAVLAPVQALRQNGTVEMVVVQGSTAYVRLVTVGLQTAEVVEVVSGVSEGDMVVTLGPASIQDGQTVKVVNR